MGLNDNRAISHTEIHAKAEAGRLRDSITTIAASGAEVPQEFLDRFTTVTQKIERLEGKAEELDDDPSAF